MPWLENFYILVHNWMVPWFGGMWQSRICGTKPEVNQRCLAQSLRGSEQEGLVAIEILKSVASLSPTSRNKEATSLMPAT